MWVVDAAVGHGALAVNVEVATVLFPVFPVLEAQGHVLVTLTRLLVTLCLVEFTCGWEGCKPLTDGAAAPTGCRRLVGEGSDLKSPVALRMWPQAQQRQHHPEPCPRLGPAALNRVLNLF